MYIRHWTIEKAEDARNSYVRRIKELCGLRVGEFQQMAYQSAHTGTLTFGRARDEQHLLLTVNEGSLTHPKPVYRTYSEIQQDAQSNRFYQQVLDLVRDLYVLTGDCPGARPETVEF
jgi:hypothetical protein